MWSVTKGTIMMLRPLKLADVAIAVNSATDVAQDSADILLLRNDLSVIINGISYGPIDF